MKGSPRWFRAVTLNEVRRAGQWQGTLPVPARAVVFLALIGCLRLATRHTDRIVPVPLSPSPT